MYQKKNFKAGDILVNESGDNAVVIAALTSPSVTPPPPPPRPAIAAAIAALIADVVS